MTRSPLEYMRQRPAGIPMSEGAEERLAPLLEGWYGGAGRHYHAWTHVAWCLDQLAALVEEDAGIEHVADVFGALLFHDAIYDPSRKDNEEASARLAREHLPALFPTIDLDRVGRLILLTGRHGRLDREELSEEERLFLDVDTSVLGSDDAAYRAYADGVRREYEPLASSAATRRGLWRGSKWAPQKPVAGGLRYAFGRKAFLLSLLAAPTIFLSGRYHGRLEARARENVRRELLGL